MKIEYSPQFRRAYRKLPPPVKKAAERQGVIFRENPFDQRLGTHKLSGRLKDYWAFWIDYKHRTIFSFLNSGTVRLHTTGDHSIYKKFKP